MTPRQFRCLTLRYERKVKQEDRRAGGVIAALYNIHTRESETDPVKDWQDYFPEWREEQREQTEDEMFELMQLFAAKNNEGLSN